MTNKNRETLNITFGELSIGDFSDNHLKIAVLLNGKHISYYQWNPFYNMSYQDACSYIPFKHYISRTTIDTDNKCLFDLFSGKVRGKTLYKDKIQEILGIFTKCDIKPTLYEVESCIILDATCFECSEDFKDFCCNYGYSDDSIKAKEVYDSCKEVYLRVIQAVGSPIYEKLKKIHEED